MPSLYLRVLIACAAVLAVGACFRRTMEGAWYGPLPETSGEACRIWLFKDGSFEAQCPSDPPLLVRGAFRLDGEALWMRRTAVFVGARENTKFLRGWNEERRYEVSGPGNRITLSGEDGREYIWERKPE